VGGMPWSYFVPYQENIEKALQELRERVFESKQYRGSEVNPKSIDDALSMYEEIGTASILDVTYISEKSEFSSVSPLSNDDLDYFFNTTMPTREMIENNRDFFDDIDRGCAIYIILYKDGEPDEIFFAGYSID
jgi:hypothetical protein